jgi:hypothetical protein
MAAAALLACQSTGGSGSAPDEGAGETETTAEVTGAEVIGAEVQADGEPVLVEVTPDAPSEEVEVAKVTPPAPDIPPEIPTPEDTPVADVPPAVLTGQEPAEAKTLPSVEGVVDSTNTTVLADQLLGHWTVMWFYPMASTSG